MKEREQKQQTSHKRNTTEAAGIGLWLLRFILFVITSILFVVGANLVIAFLQSTIPNFPLWVTFLFLLISAVVLYIWRSRFPLYYGAAEFTVGFITAFLVFVPTNFDYTSLQPLAYLQILGGLYIMVRGLDNMNKGVEGTWVEPYWKRVFSDKKDRNSADRR